MTKQLEARARRHLEIGYEPDVAPRSIESEWDDDEARYLGDAVTCWGCGGEGNEVACVDDLCHGQGWCMHGDNRPCRECGGEGVL